MRARRIPSPSIRFPVQVCELLDVGTNPNCTADPRDTQNSDQGFKPLHLAAINGYVVRLFCVQRTSVSVSEYSVRV